MPGPVPPPHPDASTPSTTDGGAIDAESIRQLVITVGGDDDPAIMVELVDMFAADAPGALDGLRAALAAADGKLLARRAHTLKGSARTLGALALADRCEALEKEVRAGALAGGATHVAAIEGLLSAAVAGLQRQAFYRR